MGRGPEQRHVRSTETFSRGARVYREGIAVFTSVTARRLVEIAEVQPGDRVVDLGTGPGVVAAVAMDRGARCIGVDGASGMLVEARATVGGGLWVRASGEAPPFACGTADIVTSAYAFGCIAPGGRLSEGVLSMIRPGGRLAFSNWVPESSTNVRILEEVVEKHGDPEAPSTPGYPDWLFPSLEVYRRLMRSPGLRDGGAEIVLHHWRLRSPYDLFDSLLGINPRLNGHSAHHLRQIREASAERAERYRDGSVIRLPMQVAYGWATLVD